MLVFPRGFTEPRSYTISGRHGIRILMEPRCPARLSSRSLAVVFAATPVGAPSSDTTVYLTLDQAPKSLFPGAQIERKDVPSTHEFKEKLKAKLGRVTPTVWEQSYVTFTARQDNKTVGYAVVVDEIGKVNPFTLIVSATPDFSVRDVAVMVYREPRGGEITQKRFLAAVQGEGIQRSHPARSRTSSGSRVPRCRSRRESSRAQGAVRCWSWSIDEREQSARSRLCWRRSLPSQAWAVRPRPSRRALRHGDVV